MGAKKIQLRPDTREWDLGRHPHRCRICGREGLFASYLVREMQQGTEEEFEYFVCDCCNCLQIAEIPENLGDYYGEGYFSFRMEEEPDRQYEVPVKNMLRILDVGCGSGEWLVRLAEDGCGYCRGCDPFIEKDLRYGERVLIRKCSIHEMPGDHCYDYIHMGDSFEHVADPLETMQSAARLLKPGGTLEITLPVFPNAAFDRYGAHWYQIDAPRHICLHSVDSLRYLADRSGLIIDEIRYNATMAEFLVSYFYQQGVHYPDVSTDLVYEYFTPAQIDEIQKQVEENNAKGYGDRAVVFLTGRETGKAGSVPGGN